MAETLEALKGSGGSIKLGTRGTISSLISRELEPSSASSSKVPLAPSTSSANTPRKLKLRVSASNIQTSNVEDNNSKKSGTPNKHHPKSCKSHHQIPMLEADGISVHGSPVRVKKRGVQVVDIKCGTSDTKWVKPIITRLKKLGFSKLSDSVG